MERRLLYIVEEEVNGDGARYLVKFEPLENGIEEEDWIPPGSQP